jgi:hypothetical protein
LYAFLISPTRATWPANLIVLYLVVLIIFSELWSSLCFYLTQHQAMKAYWESGGIAPCILDIGTSWRWLVSFTPRPLYPRERAPYTHWTRGWVGPRAGLDTVVKRKINSPYRDSNSQSSTP